MVFFAYLCAEKRSPSPMKRLLKWLGIALAVPLLLILVAGMLLYVPPVQDFAVRKVAAYVSEQTGTDVTVGRLRLSFPLDLDVQQLTMLDAGGDTLVVADHALVDLDLSSIFRGRVGLDAVTLQRAQVDTREWIASTLIRGRLDELTLHDDVDLKAQHVALSSVEARGLDLDIALRDTTTEEDTTESAPLAWIIDVERAAIAKRVKAGEISIDELPQPVVETAETEEIRKEIEKQQALYRATEEGDGDA